jgi:toxin CptA
MVRANFRPSLQLAIVVALSHAAAAALSFTIDLWQPLRLGLLACIAASLAYALYGPALLRTRNSIVAAVLKDDGFLIQTGRGTWHAAVLQDSSFVAPYLTILNVQIPGWRFTRHIVILPDRMDAETFRQLRVWLRWRKEEDAGASS